MSIFVRPLKKNMMKYLWLLASLLLAGCTPSEKPQRENPLQGAWVLSKVEFPMGGIETFPFQGMRPLRIYEGDSMMLQCGLTQTASELVVHYPYERSRITLISKGRGEYVYLEDEDPRPLTVTDDTTIVIQRNGRLYTWHRADDLDREWGEEIRAIIADNDLNEEAAQRYVLSAKERTQENIIHVFVYACIAIVILLLLIAHIAVTNHKARLRLQLQLQQIREEHEERPQSIRHAIERMEKDYFVSRDYLSLQHRIATGQRLKDEEWNGIEEQVKKVYPGFCSQLRTLYPMSELEYHTCLLIKLRIAPTDIAAVLSRDVSTISTVRSRLYKKVFGRKGGAREWDDFILSMGA